MRKRPLLLTLLLGLLLLALTVPVLAQEGYRFSHSADYVADGFISIEKQIGDPCATGAVKYQTILGYGAMTKSETIDIAQFIITVQDQVDWSTAEDALRNLSVTSTIELCARPMITAAFDFSPRAIFEVILDLIEDSDLEDLLELAEDLNLAGLLQQLENLADNDVNLEDLDLSLIFAELEDLYGDYDLKEGDPVSPYDPAVIDGRIRTRRKTDQTWGVSVSANQGHVGSYFSDFIAAYGPGPIERELGFEIEPGEIIFFEKDVMWWFDEMKKDGIDRGDRYVGNYFDIEQYVYTSDGDTRRYISMSSPFSEALFIEQMKVIGMAEVDETFSMLNLEPGPKAITFAWYALF